MPTRLPAVALTAFAALLACVTTLSGCVPGMSATFRNTVSLTVPHQEPSGLRVLARNGRVTVTRDAGAGDVRISAEIRAVSEDRLKDVKVVAERDEQGALAIAAVWPGGQPKDNEGISFDIVVPSATGVAIESSNGALDVRGLTGPASLKTSNGAVSVAGHEGPVTVNTSNGRITISDVPGVIETRTSNGTIIVTNAGQAVTADTSNGKIEVRLLPTSAGPVNLDTSNGGVLLEVGPAFAGRLDVDTSNGAIRTGEGLNASLISQDRTNLSLQFGESSARSVIDTSNGSVTINPVR